MSKNLSAYITKKTKKDYKKDWWKILTFFQKRKRKICNNMGVNNTKTFLK